MSFFKKFFSKTPVDVSGADIDYKKIWDDLQSTIRPLAKPCVRLIKTTENTQSKLGGKPRVNPNAFEWPYINDKPMSFLAQLDLAELSNVHKIEWLANKGHLLFFYEIGDEMVWGFDPKDKGHWKIIYELNPTTEIDFPSDLDEDYQLQTSFISPISVSVLPNYDRDVIESLNLSDEQIDAYIDYQDTDQGDEPRHQVDGYPSPVQGDGMELDSQLASNGLYCGDASGYEDPRRKQLEAGAKDWRLLFQMDTDDDLDIMWGDCGMLYFWIKEQDARNNDFDKSWFILQCS